VCPLGHPAVCEFGVPEVEAEALDCNQIAALVETVGKVAWEGIAGSWEMQEMGHSERVLESPSPPPRQAAARAPSP
jgi:hypothetical protein